MASITGLGQTSAAAYGNLPSAFSRIDQDGSGGISKAELAQALQTADSSGSKAVVDAAAKSAMTSSDANGDGALSMDEFSALVAKAQTQGGAASTTRGTESGTTKVSPPRGGPSPGGSKPGGPASASGGGSAEVSSSSNSTSSDSGSSSKITDPADANGDGIVTSAEQLSYDVKHPGAETSS